jgi:hypothetical protein
MYSKEFFAGNNYATEELNGRGAAVCVERTVIMLTSQ